MPIYTKTKDGKLNRIDDYDDNDIRTWTLARYAIELIFLACAFLFIFYGLPVLITLIFGES